jgi:hypothetical protein
MNLIDIQPAVVGLLQADTRFEGVPILADDGTYPKTPGREAALAGPGLVLIVWEIESDGLVDGARTGLASHDVYVPVVIEENPTACRSSWSRRSPATKPPTLCSSTTSSRGVRTSARPCTMPCRS